MSFSHGASIFFMHYPKDTMPPARRLVKNKDLTQNALKRVEAEAKQRGSAKEKALKDLVDAARERTEDNRPLVRAGKSTMRDRPKKRAANTWVQALKGWNAKKGGGTWCIPKKGSAEHAQVRAMMK